MERIWIDALEFDDYGGFRRDTQFVREMGQGYLLADGVGTPAAPAAVKFSVLQKGMYRVFLRTKNWCVGYEPDGLIVEVDGKKSGHVSGMMQIPDWYFETAGDFELDAGVHTLRIYDTTGWFGRFSAVVITDDFDFCPSPEKSRWKAQRAAMKGLKDTVTDHGHYDLLIAGGGVPGVTAAVTAARHGLRVALLNDRPVLGGNGSEEGNVTLEGAAHRGYHETGVIYEIKNIRQEEKISWSDAFDRFVKKEVNITVFSNMLVDDCQCENGRIRTVHAVDTVDLTEHSFSADQFVDNTGDGWLGYYAGAYYHIGREARWEYGEDFAPEVADGNTMSGCNGGTHLETGDAFFSYCADYADEETPFIAPDWAFKLPQGEEMNRQPHTIDRGEWWLENRNDYDDLWNQEYTRDALIRVSAGFFDWLKNSWPEKERAAKLKLTGLATFNAKRESRRLIGDHVMTQNDFRLRPDFPDAVCYCGWNIDVHHIMGIFSGREGAFTCDEKIGITQLPFRCLYSKNIDNLMMAGRDISVSHIGLGPARVMLTGASMGQAVATAAVLCKKYNLDPREVGKQHMDELQQMLLKDGQSIPGCTNHDPRDLALTAVITADSWESGGRPENVINGRTRATDGGDYAWISGAPLPQSLILTLKEPREISQVRVTLDMPFARYTMGYQPMPSKDETLADFTVDICVDGEWKCVGKVKNNIQRLVVLDFTPSLASAVRINALRATAIDRAVIPEVRIY
ncbi:MAG TPA: FAD-dependent oxidoreductase [Candidatus Eisenbergiella merdipullorum]|uniref:FAD-dependent oxidoreductase n=1 Tax=Candidatus Eisenbergiella merdipullorum TaxID=2838553 RepID=A0A9D2I9R4_9FIRM|nr:FAD-dependent oxidoreductase [Candidatus Eisenbergiella merdipullorum]